MYPMAFATFTRPISKVHTISLGFGIIARCDLPNRLILKRFNASEDIAISEFLRNGYLCTLQLNGGQKNYSEFFSIADSSVNLGLYMYTNNNVDIK